MRGPKVSNEHKAQLAEKAILDAIEYAYSGGSFVREKLISKLKFAVDKSIPGVYAKAGQIVNFALDNKTFDRSKAESFIRNTKPYDFQKPPVDTWRLEDIFEAEELYEAYPQLKDILIAEYPFDDELLTVNFKDIVDETIEPPLSASTYDDSKTDELLAMTTAGAGAERSFRMLYPDHFTRLQIAQALIAEYGARDISDLET